MRTMRWMSVATVLATALATVLAAGAALSACGGEEQTPTPQPEPETPAPAVERPLRELVGTTFEALPAEQEIDRDKMLLGRALFHDNRLSGDETIACSTCHMLSHGGAEPRRTSTGIRGQTGPINSPSVLNATFNFVQFWDGRAADLTEQAAGPVTNPVEMGGEWPVILERLRADAEYPAKFQASYGESGITQENVINAIVEYERYLVTPAPFDRWLGGDDSALDEQAQRGLRTFIETGCTTCHQGRNVGGSMYQRMGLVQNYFERRGGPLTEADMGRFNVTHEESDRHKFKVPSLRNIALTPPYFHDGSEQELGGAVRTMAAVQLNRELTDAQVADIVAFLGSLTGELPGDARVPGAAGTEPAATREAAPGATAPTPAE